MPKKIPEITPTREEILEVVSYDPATGIFTLLVDEWRQKKGKILGHAISSGHIVINFSGRAWLASRIAWRIITGEDPGEFEVDHKDQNKQNNTEENLRLATLSQQNWNKPLRKDNKSGFRGVHKAGKKYIAQIRIDGVQLKLGYFETPEAASEAYKAKAREIQGEYYVEC